VLVDCDAAMIFTPFIDEVARVDVEAESAIAYLRNTRINQIDYTASRPHCMM
jgi:hypothetical protein